MIITSPTNRLIIFMLFSFLQCGCNQNKKEVPGNIRPRDSLSNNETINPYVASDQSPLDLSYFPKDFPVLRMNGANENLLVARVIYSRPHKKNRLIFGNSDKSLVHYGKEWRLGANEATEITFFKPVSIQGKQVKQGSYIMYCVPHPDQWTLILNNNLYTWGLHMDPARDVMKFEIPVQEQSPALEDFTIIFETTSTGADMIMAWDQTKAVLPVTVKK